MKNKFKKMLLLLILLCVIGSIFQYVNYKEFKNTSIILTDISDSIKIHFIHGSVPLKGCSDTRDRMGGKLGGHIEIEIDSSIFGFEIKNKYDGVHWISRRYNQDFDSKFTKLQIKIWKLQTSNDKITSILIPVNQSTKKSILNICNEYHAKPPYDYAFLGMRCASSTYEIIAKSGILHEKSKSGYIFYAFYPRLFRHKLLEFANINNLTIELKDGIKCRDWD